MCILSNSLSASTLTCSPFFSSAASLRPFTSPSSLSSILFGGVLASLNHTRFDVKAPLFPAIYQVKFHDIHHWYPDSNYGQYTVLWDYIFGWFKPYPNDQRGVRASAAISPATSKLRANDAKSD
jgi:sterol desaturase/sphingolipid hydroxylase (fatty acid hydroxylase superfamily)